MLPRPVLRALRRTLYHRLELSLCPIITAHYSTRVAQPSTSPSILHSSSTAPEHAQYDDPTRLQQLKESPEKGDEEEGGEEKETVYQVITYIHRLPPDLTAIALRNFFWKKDIFVVEASKTIGKLSGIIQTSVEDQEDVMSLLAGVRAPWGTLVMKPGGLATRDIELSEEDFLLFEELAESESVADLSAEKTLPPPHSPPPPSPPLPPSCSPQDLPHASAIMSSSTICPEFPPESNSELDRPASEPLSIRPEAPTNGPIDLYTERIHNLSSFKVIAPKWPRDLTAKNIQEALKKQGFTVPTTHIEDDIIRLDISPISHQELRNILWKRFASLKGAYIEIYPLSWAFSPFPECTHLEDQSDSSLLISSLSPMMDAPLLLQYLQALAPDLDVYSICWIEKMVQETWAIVSVQGQPAFHTVLNLHRKCIGGVPVDVRALPLRRHPPAQPMINPDKSKDGGISFFVSNIPFNLSPAQLAIMFQSTGQSSTINFMKRLGPRGAVFEILDAGPQEIRDLEALHNTLIHGRFISVHLGSKRTEQPSRITDIQVPPKITPPTIPQNKIEGTHV